MDPGDSLLNKETILDVTVNIIPLAIIAVFVVLFVVISPWGFDLSLIPVLQLLLLLAPFVLLAVLTYVAADRIER